MDMDMGMGMGICVGTGMGMGMGMGMGRGMGMGMGMGMGLVRDVVRGVDMGMGMGMGMGGSYALRCYDRLSYSRLPTECADSDRCDRGGWGRRRRPVVIGHLGANESRTLSYAQQQPSDWAPPVGRNDP